MLNRLPELPVYKTYPIKLASGKGAYVYDEAGTEYLDMYGGHAVAVTGHCHPAVVDAIVDQAQRLIFYSNAVETAHRRELCEKLVALGKGAFGAVFLVNSGAEANEAALTIARLATGRKKVAAVSGGFHGRSLLTLSLCGIERYRALSQVGGTPIMPHATILPAGDVRTAEETIDDSFSAIIVEPIQGLAGCVVMTDEYLTALRRICDRTGALLVFDEVQCGMGRTGTFLASEQVSVRPDMATLAKGLGGGFPIAATLVGERLISAVKPGDLGTTFGGGPLGCAAASANLDVLQSERMIENAHIVGDFLSNQIAALPGVKRVQGRGLLLGAVLDQKAEEVVERLILEQHIIAGGSAAADVLRIMPPLSLRREQAERFVAGLAAVLERR